jgi:hypothetical protein
MCHPATQGAEAERLRGNRAVRAPPEVTGCTARVTRFVSATSIDRHSDLPALRAASRGLERRKRSRAVRRSEAPCLRRQARLRTPAPRYPCDKKSRCRQQRSWEFGPDCSRVKEPGRRRGSSRPSPLEPLRRWARAFTSCQQACAAVDSVLVHAHPLRSAARHPAHFCFHGDGVCKPPVAGKQSERRRHSIRG